MPSSLGNLSLNGLLMFLSLTAKPSASKSAALPAERGVRGSPVLGGPDTAPCTREGSRFLQCTPGKGRQQSEGGMSLVQPLNMAERGAEDPLDVSMLERTLGPSFPLKPYQKSQFRSGLDKCFSPRSIHQQPFKRQQRLFL